MINPINDSVNTRIIFFLARKNAKKIPQIYFLKNLTLIVIVEQSISHQHGIFQFIKRMKISFLLSNQNALFIDFKCRVLIPLSFQKLSKMVIGTYIIWVGMNKVFKSIPCALFISQLHKLHGQGILQKRIVWAFS